jgi:hypothetical protein
MWGYFLPGLHIIFSEKAENRLILFQSCGPVIDRLILEAGEALGLQFRIYPRKMSRMSTSADAIVHVARWDIPLLGFDSFSIARKLLTEMRLKAFFKETIKQAIYFWGLARIRQRMAPLLREVYVRLGAQESKLDCSYLLLERSTPPEFYINDEAEISGYGSSRRYLANFDAIEKTLRGQDIPVWRFEPGACGFAEQVRVFTRCAGVIGVRGAEFANTIFVPKGSLVITGNFLDNKAPAANIALVKGFLNYNIKVSGQKPAFNISPSAIVKCIRNHERRN